MATFLSGVSIGTWSGYGWTATLTGNVSRSGNTVTLSSLYCSTAAANAWGTSSGTVFMIQNNGGGELTRHTGITMNNGSGGFSFNNVSVTVGASTTSYTFRFYCSDNGVSHNFTVTFPAGQTAPATPTCTPTASSASLINISWGTTNLGNPTGSVSLYNGTTNNPTNLLQTKTTTVTNIFGNDQRTANTTYYYKATASNSVGTVSSAVASATTFPAGLTSLTATNVKPTEATLTAVFASSGNALTTGVEARINQSGSWNDLGLSDVQGTTQSITLSPFLPETTYTVELRVRTTAGTSSVSSVTFTTPPESKFYGSVNGQAKRITKLYGSVNGQTKKITKLYGSVNGQAKLIYKG